ncbi:hypothetical protein BXZ70DRAFT_1011998 [Cristinia sonorae]|uniref:Dynamin N-terminal domain-containing protein n=1 Tax=Cristinia sonorae TaxID=1940300 RepID=A0A8K0UFY3_9AGAR|nr:hypothetical protein BXZ70DRAFT_1011998 [Cristinia sonorae]
MSHSGNDMDPQSSSDSEQSVDGVPEFEYKIDWSPETTAGKLCNLLDEISLACKKLRPGYKPREEAWTKTEDDLRQQLKDTPKTMVAVVGVTGAGKSSMMNAVLGCNIVPTSGMQACTAVATEISYHAENTIEGDVSFLSRDEWQDELAFLRDDLKASLEKDAAKPGIEEAGSSISAVYPSVTQDQFMALKDTEINDLDPRITNILGSTVHISADTPESFLAEMCQYVHSSGGDRRRKERRVGEQGRNVGASGALWPLIRHVKVRSNAMALATGVILVDLPGVADANAARNLIAKQYMKKCDKVWIVAPIIRAADQKDTDFLLVETLKKLVTQMKMDGTYDEDAITFIVTKCDDVSCSEVIASLDDDALAELDLIENEQTNCKAEIHAQSQIQTTAAASMKDMNSQLRKTQRKLKALLSGRDASTVQQSSKEPVVDMEPQVNTLQPLKDSKKRESNEEGPPSKRQKKADEIVDRRLVEVKVAPQDSINTCKDMIKDIETSLSMQQKLWYSTAERLDLLQRKTFTLQRKKIIFCSLQRNEITRTRLIAMFRATLKSLADASMDPVNLALERNDHGLGTDYSAITLPIFMCSSRDYVRITGQIEGDGEPVCFENVEDTGIPDIQQWCHALTIGARSQAVADLLIDIETHALSVQDYAQVVTSVTPEVLSVFRKKWNQDCPENSEEVFGVAQQLLTDFKPVVRNCVKRLQDVFQGTLGDVCATGAVLAVEIAEDVLTNFYETKMKSRWQTFRAALRRHGCWKHDLNDDLSYPFTSHIASTWAGVFETDLFASFGEDITERIRAKMAEIEASAPCGLKDAVKVQGERAVKEANATVQKILRRARLAINKEQKEISRSLSPQIQTRLTPGYDEASAIQGRGSVAAQQTSFREFLEENKEEIFQDVADVVVRRLSTAAEAVGVILNTAVAELAEKIELSVALLWEGPTDNMQMTTRKQVIQDMSTIVDKLRKLSDQDSNEEEPGDMKVED